MDRKPNCNLPVSACFDPRFIGGDYIVFYFHGSRNQHFGLVSDPNLQINAHFIGLRPAGRPRDYTWIQAPGIMFGTHTFTVEAKRTETWSDEEDHLLFSHDEGLGHLRKSTETYRQDYENPAKAGVAMPVVGGKSQLRTSSLLSSDCAACIFSPAEVEKKESSMLVDFGTLDCTSTLGNGMGINNVMELSMLRATWKMKP
ncbi:hypothetical protein ACLOJK_014180 [Asimina triloba]